MWHTVNRFLLWFPVALGGIIAFYTSSLLVSAAIWPGAKREAEAEWSWLVWAMNTIWIPIALAVLAAIWVWAYFWTENKHHKTIISPNPTVSDYGELSLYIDVGGYLPTKSMVGNQHLIEHIVSVSRKGTVGFGFRGSPFSDGQPVQFEWKPFNVATEKCIVTNYGERTLTDVMIGVHIQVMEVLTTEGGTRSGDVIAESQDALRIAKIDPGKENTETIFVSNPTPYFVAMTISGATATPIAGKSPVEVSVKTNARCGMIHLWPRKEQ